jgi:ribosome-binding factor A
MSLRSEKVASIVKEELGTLFQRNFPMEEFGLLTVTEVRMSPDLKNAKVFISVFGDDARKQKTLSLLEEKKAFVRQSVGRNVRLRFTPTIEFSLDETMDKAISLETIFKKIHDEESQRGKEK